MRVIAGSARSMPLKTIEGLETRPTQDRIKETLFNTIQTKVQGCVFIDLFSGSGAIGIEALSRGAAKAYFIEHSEKAYECIKNNLTFTKLGDKAVVKKADVLSGIGGIMESEVDYIYLDPPYSQGLEECVLESLSKMKYVTEDTVIIVEAALDTDFTYVSEYGLEVTRQKQYRTNQHVFITRIEA